MTLIPRTREEVHLENHWRGTHGLGLLDTPSARSVYMRERVEHTGASHRVTQKLPGGAEVVSPTYSNGSKVNRTTSPRGQQPRSLMFDKEGGHDRAALGSASQARKGVQDVKRAERKAR